MDFPCSNSINTPEGWRINTHFSIKNKSLVKKIDSCSIKLLTCLSIQHSFPEAATGCGTVSFDIIHHWSRFQNRCHLQIIFVYS